MGVAVDSVEEGYFRDDVYNVDETGVNWKALLRKSLAPKQESPAPGFKISKERVTDMGCANSSGAHSLPLLVIGKSKKPLCFKNISRLPTLNKAQKSAKQVLRRLLLAENDEASVAEKLNMKDASYILAEAWDSLERRSLKNAWNNLWPDLEAEKNLNDDHREEITDFVQSIAEFQECDEEDVETRMACDAEDCRNPDGMRCRRL
ncbi:HTH CENPB-type domain-containing protein [Trichonephila clavipes]|nr:HTH CENPB-type domain-containing protein [Trichonephila clavipes]